MPTAREEYEPILRQWCAWVKKEGYESVHATEVAQKLAEPWKRLTKQEQSEMRILSFQLLKKDKSGGG